MIPSKDVKAVRMPAEWEPHDATWIAWPHHADDWPEKFPSIDWVYAEIALHLAQSERVEILCHNEQVQQRAEECCRAHGVGNQLRFHLAQTDRSWLRDSLPTLVYGGQHGAHWVSWKFNAWAKYDNFSADAQLSQFVSSATNISCVDAIRLDNGSRLVLEGGAFDVDGDGTLLTTEECLLSTVQQRNPELTRAGYDSCFNEYLGISKVIWLSGSCAGDDTHGHVDDAARFVRHGAVVIALETDETEAENFRITQANHRILRNSHDAHGRTIDVIPLPMPTPRHYFSDRLPASYANFYIANSVVLVPTFNDRNDSRAISILQEQFPDRDVIGIHAVDLVLGFGTLHCLTQQQPSL